MITFQREHDESATYVALFELLFQLNTKLLRRNFGAPSRGQLSAHGFGELLGKRTAAASFVSIFVSLCRSQCINLGRVIAIFVASQPLLVELDRRLRVMTAPALQQSKR